MYLLEGTAQNEEKLFTYNNIYFFLHIKIVIQMV